MCLQTNDAKYSAIGAPQCVPPCANTSCIASECGRLTSDYGSDRRQFHKSGVKPVNTCSTVKLGSTSTLLVLQHARRGSVSSLFSYRHSQLPAQRPQQLPYRPAAKCCFLTLKKGLPQRMGQKTCHRSATASGRPADHHLFNDPPVAHACVAQAEPFPTLQRQAHSLLETGLPPGFKL